MPSDIPASPDNVYKDKGWISWGDWLGTGTIAPNQRKFRKFREARIFVRELNLKTLAEWRAFV